MTVLFCCILLWSSIRIVLAIPVLDYYLPSSSNINLLRLECIENDVIHSTARFRIYNSTDKLIRERHSDSGRHYLTYNITEDFEVLIRCVIPGGEPSAATRFIGKINSWHVANMHLYNNTRVGQNDVGIIHEIMNPLL